MKKYKILFTDLDGTLIDTISNNKFPIGIWDMKINFKVLDAIKKLNPNYICIISNQGGIEKGFIREEHFNAKFKYIINSVNNYTGINTVGDYCPYNDIDNPYRKPNTENLSKRLYRIGYYYDSSITKQDCLMIGDASGLEGQFSDTDKKTAENFGIDYFDVNEFVNKYTIETPYINN